MQRLAALDISYRGSPIVEGAGARYFDESLRGGGIRSRFLLVLGGDVNAAARESAQRLADGLRDVVELRAGKGEGIVLVRPTGMPLMLPRRITESRRWRKCVRFWNGRLGRGSRGRRHVEQGGVRWNWRCVSSSNTMMIRSLFFVLVTPPAAPAQSLRVVAIAHRGEHLRHPENTMPAFEEAVRLGADYIEVDVRTTQMAGWC